ncbi:MAG: ABC transporter ATP-binding protein [Saccharolobus sp.]|uniref:ABC transporter ATP-binding protein n=1 Tax=Saccharolobus sp. TaxID=2100761 RepID=UPI0031778115
MLKAHKLNVAYGILQVLWDVSFNVEKGEIVALIGPNGAGKTTTLLTLAGINTPISGEIYFNNSRITTLSPYERVELGLTLVPEGRKIFPYLTVYENLLSGAYSRRARKKIKDSIEFVTNLFPVLKERKNQLAYTLSGGEQQMLAIGRALMSCPSLLMLDEPSWGLAPTIIETIMTTIKKLREEGITILIVEQNVMDALEISDRAYVLETGRIVLEGYGKDLVNNDYIRRVYLGIA